MVIKTRQLSKKYKDFAAVQSINLTLEKGCIYGLIGRNGAGKTTLLKMLTGQTKATSGDIYLFGKTGSELNQVRKRIGAIVEYPAFFPDLTGKQNLEYYRIQKGIAEKSSVNRVLKVLNLLAFSHKKFKHYSLGNKQRLGLALALLGNPDLLILDEPTNGFDPMGMTEMRQTLLELNQKHHITILISSHILSELEHLITKVGLINQGQLIEELEMKVLYEKCQTSIEIKVNEPEKTTAILEERLGLTEYEVLTEGILNVRGSQTLIPQISKVLNEQNIKVYAIKEIEGSLEDYFIQLIGGIAHD